MKIKDFDKAQKLYDLIVKLDAEIITLDKKGTLLAAKDQTCKMSLTFEVDEKPTEISALQTEASDLSRKYGVRISVYPANNGFIDIMNLTSERVNTDVINLVLTDLETLHVIDQLINFKKIKRRKYIAELKDLGFVF